MVKSLIIIIICLSVVLLLLIYNVVIIVYGNYDFVYCKHEITNTTNTYPEGTDCGNGGDDDDDELVIIIKEEESYAPLESKEWLKK